VTRLGIVAGVVACWALSAVAMAQEEPPLQLSLFLTPTHEDRWIWGVGPIV
jgi:hypothetical protein